MLPTLVFITAVAVHFFEHPLHLFIMFHFLVNGTVFSSISNSMTSNSWLMQSTFLSLQIPKINAITEHTSAYKHAEGFYVFFTYKLFGYGDTIFLHKPATDLIPDVCNCWTSCPLSLQKTAVGPCIRNSTSYVIFPFLMCSTIYKDIGFPFT